MSRTYATCEHCQKINAVATEKSGQAVCGHCKKLLTYHDGLVEVSSAALQKLIQHSPIPVVVDFWAPWCAPCRSFAPTFQQSAQHHAGEAVFAKANTEANPDLSTTHGIRGIPTLALFHKGKELRRISGALPSAQFEQWLREGLINVQPPLSTATN